MVFIKNVQLKHREAGFSLLMAIIGLAVCAILATVAAQATGNNLVEAKKVEAIGQKSELRQTIRVRTNCRRTLPQLRRNQGQGAFLLDRTGRRIDGRTSGPMRVGNWEFSVASWDRSSGRIAIAANTRDYKTASLFEADPLVCR